MLYNRLMPQVEAERVTLAGTALYVALLENKPYLIAAEAFDLLFTLADAPAPATRSKRGENEDAMGASRTKILAMIREFGPMTTAEAGSHAFPGNSHAAYNNVQPHLKKLAEAGYVERRADPNNGGIEKWFAIEKEDAC